MWERLCWYPFVHLLQFTPVTPSLHGHCPVVWLHVFPRAPTGWQSQAAWAINGRWDHGNIPGKENQNLKRVIKANKLKLHCLMPAVRTNNAVMECSVYLSVLYQQVFIYTEKTNWIESIPISTISCGESSTERVRREALLPKVSDWLNIWRLVDKLRPAIKYRVSLYLVKCI